MLFEYLNENYKAGEPIFFDDIRIEGIQRNTLRQQMKKLADSGKIVRYEKWNSPYSTERFDDGCRTFYYAAACTLDTGRTMAQSRNQEISYQLLHS